MRHIAIAVAAALTLAALAPAARADGQSSVSTRKLWYQDLRLGFLGWSYGPSFGQFTSGRSATPMGDLGSPVTVGTQFNLSAPAGFGDFRYTAVEALTWNPFDPAQGSSLMNVGNPAFGVAGTHVEGDRASWWARYEISPALNEASRSAGQQFTLRAIKSLGYALGAAKRWKLGAIVVPAWTVARAGSSHSVYAMPSLNYTLTDRLSWGMFVETAYSHAAGTGILDWSKAMDPNLAIGPTYSFKSGYWLQPFVNLYPGGRVNADTTHLGVYFGGRVL